MIKLNDREYNEYKIKVEWSNFSVCNQGKRRTGVAPFITFNLDNNIFIGLEFTFSKEMFRTLQLNKKLKIEKFISDILYADGKGWISIVNENYNCYIMKKNDNLFNIEFNSENIVINSDIELFL